MTPPPFAQVAPLPPWYPVLMRDRFTSAAPNEIEYVLARCLPDMVRMLGVGQGGAQSE
jgi:hypothetical protein